VWVAPAAGPRGVKWRISTDGGIGPRWRYDGKELYYINRSNRIMAVEVHRTGSTFAMAGKATGVAAFSLELDGAGNPFDVTRDGKQFLINKAIDIEAVPPLTLIVNWLRPRR
jgi:hypothetical protein